MNGGLDAGRDRRELGRPDARSSDCCPALPGRLPRAPIVVAQHRDADAEDDCSPGCSTAHSPLPVVEADDKDAARARDGLLAPPGYHLLSSDGARRAVGRRARAVHAARRSTCCSSRRPTRTARGVVGVLLTGANADGARGPGRDQARAAATRSSRTPTTAERPEMPRPRSRPSSPTQSLPLDEIAGAAVAAVRRRRPRREPRERPAERPARRRPAREPARARGRARAAAVPARQRHLRRGGAAAAAARRLRGRSCSTSRCRASTASRPPS